MSNQSLIIGVGLFAAFLHAQPAMAAPVSYVSGKGINTGDCSSPAAPCRSFGYAITKTNPGGEIKALDASQYGSFVIDRAISITGAPGASILRTSAGNAVVVTAPTTASVTIKGLMIDGFNELGTNGIVVNSAGYVVIKDCIVKNFSLTGITVSGNSMSFVIEDTATTGNGSQGIWVNQTKGEKISGILSRFTSSHNLNQGIYIKGILVPNNPFAPFPIAPSISISDSIFSKNAIEGMLIYTASAFMTRSTVTLNGGAGVKGGGIRSIGDNIVGGNSPDFDIASSPIEKF